MRECTKISLLAPCTVQPVPKRLLMSFVRTPAVVSFSSPLEAALKCMSRLDVCSHRVPLGLRACYMRPSHEKEDLNLTELYRTSS